MAQAVLFVLMRYKSITFLVRVSDMKISSYRSVFLYFLWVIVLTVSFGNSYVFANVVVDNRDAATSQTGIWELSDGTNPYNPADPKADSVWAHGGDDSFSWHFTPSQSGQSGAGGQFCRFRNGY